MSEIVLDVDDIHAAYSEMKARGVPFEIEPRVVTGDASRTLLAAHFYDPDGHAASISGWVSGGNLSDRARSRRRTSLRAEVTNGCRRSGHDPALRRPPSQGACGVRHADEVSLDEGTSIVKEGALAYELFVIKSGTTDVLQAGEVIARMGPGDVVGGIGAQDPHQDCNRGGHQPGGSHRHVWARGDRLGRRCLTSGPSYSESSPRENGWLSSLPIVVLTSAPYNQNFTSDAGWSSLVARRAHNPKVAGSNPAPATPRKPRHCLGFSLVCVRPRGAHAGRSTTSVPQDRRRVCI